ncbi:MAG: hypothetical protein JWO43_365 [Candidatus Adlerbacteria bacterium]|nr:hypothetical protein [Candidatus Adlerbacteria bacterium]
MLASEKHGISTRPPKIEGVHQIFTETLADALPRIDVDLESSNYVKNFVKKLEYTAAKEIFSAYFVYHLREFQAYRNPLVDEGHIGAHFVLSKQVTSIIDVSGMFSPPGENMRELAREIAWKWSFKDEFKKRSHLFFSLPAAVVQLPGFVCLTMFQPPLEKLLGLCLILLPLVIIAAVSLVQAPKRSLRILTALDNLAHPAPSEPEGSPLPPGAVPVGFQAIR